MYKRLIVISALGCAIGLSASIAMAADQERNQDREQLQIQDQERMQTRDQERLRDQDIYGWQLMTPQERAEHRTKMHSLKTEEEREAYRLEHHKKMQERSKERKLTLPDMPPAQGRGMGPGAGGMGPHGGRGPGGGGRSR